MRTAYSARRSIPTRASLPSLVCVILCSCSRIDGLIDFFADGNSGPDASDFISKHILDFLIGEYRICGGDVGAAVAKAILATDHAFGRS